MRFPRLSAVTLAAAGGLATTFGVQAQSIDVRVIGTITPAAGIPTLAGGGVEDFGKIAASTLNMTKFNPLPARTLPFSTVCQAPTQVAVHVNDNRAASRAVGIKPGGLTDESGNCGLGTVSGANLGGYAMLMSQGTSTADGNKVDTINAADGGVTWGPVGRGALYHAPNNLESWAAAGTIVPIAFTNLAGTFTAEATLNRGDTLPLSGEVLPDGLATVGMV